MEPQDQARGVTVIIPAYKADATIERAVRSALDQGKEVRSVVVILDGKCSATKDAVQRVSDPRVTILVNDQRRGGSFSRNRGLALATTDHVIFLDADDYVEGGLIFGLAVQARKTGVAIVFGPWRSMESNSGKTGAPFYPDYRDSADLVTRWLARHEYVPPCAVLWQRSFLERIGGWDESLIRNQDGELVLRAILLGASFRCSSRGMGIWVRYPEKASVSSRLDTAIHMLDAPARLLNLRSTVIEAQVLRRACAKHHYATAGFCFANGNPEAGRAALKASRQLGYRGHRGDRLTRILAYLTGLERAYKLKRAAAILKGSGKSYLKNRS